MRDELGENYSTGVVCLPLSQERFIKERNNSNGIAVIQVGMGTETQYFFVPVRNWVNTGLQYKRYCYRYLCCFISVYFNVNDELITFFFTEWCGQHLLEVSVIIHAHMQCVCLRAISGSKCETLQKCGLTLQN